MDFEAARVVQPLNMGPNLSIDHLQKRNQNQPTTQKRGRTPFLWRKVFFHTFLLIAIKGK